MLNFISLCNEFLDENAAKKKCDVWLYFVKVNCNIYEKMFAAKTVIAEFLRNYLTPP